MEPENAQGKSPAENEQEVVPDVASAMSASSEALEFLCSVGLEELNLCLFTDSLATVSVSGVELGNFAVSVQPAYYQLDGLEEEKCFLVHAASQGTIDGVPCGTSIIGHISYKLETLEQHVHEYVKLKGHSLDKKTQIVRQGDKLVINRIITEGEKLHRETSSHSTSLLSGLISEAANLLIMRILARRKIKDPLKFLAFDEEGNLCTSTYAPLGSQAQVIGKEMVDVFGIERTIHSPEVPTTWQCFFLSDGHLASHVQIGSPVTIKLNEMPVLSEPDEKDPKPVFEKKPLAWQEDLQLHSEFLDRKEELISDHETYLRRHPEVKVLLADFMQFLLLRKPDDIMDFAAEYFKPFSSTQEPNDPFVSSHHASPFRNVSH
ncbi:ciliogenesis-associated TTC17-interacting protein [Xenopus laevis]|uniref:Ciliogenesis-associated TTC17-interacting protein n=1 Tax=Xenopus laevis TaxID=8355 RepID=CATIP_XENLA|nr:ciliogenesis-associated TTC17-interacting protein [Xenopus laevis]Q0IHI3.1 RecName: Full=Ciliogenesis-associated TTC17-interacting protein [Xenopus laevis]AAI23144.1 MGC154331 protein [Xenopus laevis]